jgi:hypothetical protein
MILKRNQGQPVQNFDTDEKHTGAKTCFSLFIVPHKQFYISACNTNLLLLSKKCRNNDPFIRTGSRAETQKLHHRSQTAKHAGLPAMRPQKA